MSDRPLVSVITIFLNAERFIKEAVESLLGQTYYNWELLFVDDGSTDTSSAIAKRYVERYSEKMKYVEHSGHHNRGMSASRNLGIRHAKGEYIAFLDADDTYMPNKLEQQAAVLDSNPSAAFVCGRTEWWYSWTGKTEDLGRDYLQKLDVPLDSLIKPPTLLLMSLQNEMAALTADVMVRSSIVRDVGGYQESFRGMYEDQAFHAKLSLTYPAFVSSESWYRYRQHPASACYVAEATGKWASSRKVFLSWLDTYLSEKGNQDNDVRRVLKDERNKLWHYRYPALSRIRHGIGRAGNLVKRIGDLTKSARIGP